MSVRPKRLPVAVSFAFSTGIVVSASVAGAALAQTPNAPAAAAQKPKTLQTIVVTGSHIRRVELETSNPLVTVTAEQIQATGKLTLGDVVQALPVITGGGTNPRVNNGGGSGKTLVGLRGLGASRTLVLIDGQRIINNDLNSIPSSAVQRIEVLTDGASAVYGSDAIGGVINIILKSNYQGAQFSTNYGISDHDDGARKGVSFMFGQTSDKGSILAGVDYSKFDEILQGDRKFSNNLLSLTTVGGVPVAVAGGSTFAARGRIIYPGSSCALSLNPDAFTSNNSPTNVSDYHCFSSADKYNYASVQGLLTPQERTNVFFRGVYHLSDNIDAYATVFHNTTSSGYQLAPAIFGTSSGLSISKDSYYNPFGVDFTPNNGNVYRARLFPAGNRQGKFSTNTDQLIFGFRGNVNILSRDWTWDVGYNYGHMSATKTILGLPNQATLEPGLGPSFLNSNGVVQCGTVASPIAFSQCTPWDPFNLMSDSAQSTIATGSAPALTNTWNIERTTHADISGGLFDLPAGIVQLAAGASYRKEYTNNTVGPLLLLNPATGTCTLGSQCSAHLQGGYNVKEAYAELFIPILKDMPLVHALNVTLGDRYSKYSDFGSTSNWKVAMEYRPIKDLLLRGTVSKIFRAPTIGNVLGVPISNGQLLASDPCNHVTVANPACVGVPLDGTFVNQDVVNHNTIQSLVSGSAYAGFPLGPEKGKSFDFGAVYSPYYVPGLTVSSDIWRIYLNNVITPVGAQTVLNLCFAGVTEYCPLITRFQAGASAGEIQRLLLPTTNLGRLDVGGVDFAGSYRLPQFSFGQFSVGLNATYMKQFKIQTAPGEVGNQTINGAGMIGNQGSLLSATCPTAGGELCFFPRIRARGTLDWQLGPWGASWTMTYSSKFKMGSADPSQDATAVGGVPGVVVRYGAYVYNNFQVSYSIEPINTHIDVGVDNAFNKQPPILYTNNTNDMSDPTDFDVIGRYYWGRITVKF